jgi:hypothetical protein
MINWNEILEYDETSPSCLWWKVSTNPAIKIGKFAGSLKKTNYYEIGYNKKKYQCHRIIFEMFNGEIPEELFIDHIDNNRENNKIENLQLATKSENNRKSLMQKNNTSGYKGVTLEKRRNIWRANILINLKYIHLGYFNDKLEAAKAYDSAAIEYFGEFALTNKMLGLL